MNFWISAAIFWPILFGLGWFAHIKHVAAKKRRKVLQGVDQYARYSRRVERRAS